MTPEIVEEIKSAADVASFISDQQLESYVDEELKDHHQISCHKSINNFENINKNNKGMSYKLNFICICLEYEQI